MSREEISEMNREKFETGEKNDMRKKFDKEKKRWREELIKKDNRNKEDVELILFLKKRMDEMERNFAEEKRGFLERISEAEDEKQKKLEYLEGCLNAGHRKETRNIIKDYEKKLLGQFEEHADRLLILSKHRAEFVDCNNMREVLEKFEEQKQNDLEFLHDEISTKYEEILKVKKREFLNEKQRVEREHQSDLDRVKAEFKKTLEDETNKQIVNKEMEIAKLSDQHSEKTNVALEEQKELHKKEILQFQEASKKGQEVLKRKYSELRREYEDFRDESTKSDEEMKRELAEASATIVFLRREVEEVRERYDNAQKTIENEINEKIMILQTEKEELVSREEKKVDEQQKIEKQEERPVPIPIEKVEMQKQTPDITARSEDFETIKKYEGQIEQMKNQKKKLVQKSKKLVEEMKKQIFSLMKQNQEFSSQNIHLQSLVKEQDDNIKRIEPYSPLFIEPDVEKSCQTILLSSPKQKKKKKKKKRRRKKKKKKKKKKTKRSSRNATEGKKYEKKEPNVIFEPLSSSRNTKVKVATVFQRRKKLKSKNRKQVKNTEQVALQSQEEKENNKNDDEYSSPEIVMGQQQQQQQMNHYHPFKFRTRKSDYQKNDFVKRLYYEGMEKKITKYKTMIEPNIDPSGLYVYSTTPHSYLKQSDISTFTKKREEQEEEERKRKSFLRRRNFFGIPHSTKERSTFREGQGIVRGPRSLVVEKRGFGSSMKRFSVAGDKIYVPEQDVIELEDVDL